MKIEAPSLGVACEATEELISEVIPKLERLRDPLVILSSSDSTYIQALWTEDGFDLEYQDGSTEQRYLASSSLSASQVEHAFVNYLRGNSDWRGQYEFKRKVAEGDPYYRAGRSLGRVVGKLAGMGKDFAREFKKGLKEPKK